jgi:ribosomal protein S18 acetylase RimI-like enzyme
VGIGIREATTADSTPIAGLVTALGYPSSPEQMEKRLGSILSHEDYATLVACDDERVVGFVGARVGLLYEHDGGYGQIMALAVANDRRRRGIGRQLMQAAESRLMARGVSVLVVTSGNHRTEAHTFYERHGYTWTGRRFKKLLNASR